MKSLTQFINEKLSARDAIFRFVSQKVFGDDFAKTQAEFAKDIKKFLSEHSDDKVKMVIMKVKDIEKKLSNCINKEDNLLVTKTFTIEQGIKAYKWYNDIELLNETPFVCFYNVDNRDKFYLWQDSLFFFSSKDNKGNRPLKQFLTFKEEHNSYAGEFFTEIVIPRVLDPEKWNKEHKESENKKNVQARIKAIEKELEELKKQL